MCLFFLICWPSTTTFHDQQALFPVKSAEAHHRSMIVDCGYILWDVKGRSRNLLCQQQVQSCLLPVCNKCFVAASANGVPRVKVSSYVLDSCTSDLLAPTHRQ